MREYASMYVRRGGRLVGMDNNPHLGVAEPKFSAKLSGFFPWLTQPCDVTVQTRQTSWEVKLIPLDI